MDFLQSTGALALGTRLKRVSNLLVEEVAKVYQNQNINFEPRFFPVVYFLFNQGPSTITSISKALCLTHPGVVQIINALIKKGLVDSAKEKTDGRKHVVSLSSKANELCKSLTPIWNAIQASLNDIAQSGGQDFLQSISLFEKELLERSLTSRVLDRLGEKTPRFDVALWDSKYAASFHDLNVAWIEKYFRLEKSDQLVLRDPERNVIKKGGQIFFVKLDGSVVGTCALFNAGKGRYELARMAVAQYAQRRGIGRRLIEESIRWARTKKATMIFLETSSKLTSASRLYEKMGFKYCVHPKGKSDYERADLYMELSLS